MLRTLLFDMGNVLVFFSHERMCRQMGALCGLSTTEIRARVFDSGLQWAYERGQMTCAEFHEKFQQAVGKSVDARALNLAVSDIFVLNRSIEPVIAAVKTQGYRLVLLSNTSKAHFDFVWSRYGVLQQFDEHVVSFQAGAIKPERPIYEAALAAIACPPEDCFYTDDIAAYIDAAREFGLKAHLFTQTAGLLEQLHGYGIELSL